MAYRAPGKANLHPADAELNLPAEKHWHGLRQLAAIEAARGSFDDTVAAMDRHSGVGLGKLKHPGFDAHLFSCDRCAFRSGGGA